MTADPRAMTYLRRLMLTLEDIASALDRGLGDSDLTHFETEEEMREQAPVQWACMMVNRLLQQPNCGCIETYPQLVPGKVSHGPGCAKSHERAINPRDVQKMVEWFDTYNVPFMDDPSWKALLDKVRAAAKADMANVYAARSATASSLDPLTLELAEELFGCFLRDFGEGEYECGACEQRIPIKSWVTAPHRDGCAVAKARDYIALHKPECVPGVNRSESTVSKP